MSLYDQPKMLTPPGPTSRPRYPSVVTVATAKAGVSEKRLENYLKYANTDFSSALLFRF